MAFSVPYIYDYGLWNLFPCRGCIELLQYLVWRSNGCNLTPVWIKVWERPMMIAASHMDWYYNVAPFAHTELQNKGHIIWRLRKPKRNINGGFGIESRYGMIPRVIECSELLQLSHEPFRQVSTCYRRYLFLRIMGGKHKKRNKLKRRAIGQKQKRWRAIPEQRICLKRMAFFSNRSL